MMDEQERSQAMAVRNSDGGSGTSQMAYGLFYQGQGGSKHQQTSYATHQMVQQQTS